MGNPFTSYRTIESVLDVLALMSDESFLEFVLGPKYDTLRRLPDAQRHRRLLYGLWFRGQSNSEWLLRPGVFRDPPSGSEPACVAETHVVNHFRLHLVEDARSSSDLFDALSLMQHYGAPTRLLDWSENILVALFFAVQDDPLRDAKTPDDTPGSLYLLNALKLNNLTLRTPGGNMRAPVIAHPASPSVVARAAMARASSLLEWSALLAPFSARVDDENVAFPLAPGHEEVVALKSYAKPIAVWPNRSNPRLALQAGRVTLHGGKLCQQVGVAQLPLTVHLEDLVVDAKYPYENMVVRCDVRKKAVIREQLARLGIRAETLFPEREHQLHYIKEMYRHVGKDDIATAGKYASGVTYQ